MGIGHRAFEFGMELTSDKPWMTGQLHDFNKIGCFIQSNRDKTIFFEIFSEMIIEFKAMAMTFADQT